MPNFMKIERGPDFFLLIWYGMTLKTAHMNDMYCSKYIAIGFQHNSVINGKFLELFLCLNLEL